MADPSAAPPPPDPVTESVVAVFRTFPKLVDAHPSLVRRGRYFTADFQFVAGAQVCFMTAEAGRITAVETAPQIMRPAAFRIAAASASWLKLWQPAPEPGWHDILAMMKRRNLTVDGDIRTFMGNLQYIKDVIGLGRAAKGAR